MILGSKTDLISEIPPFRPKLRIGASGVHFFDRQTGVNILLDELQLPASAWSAAPRHVSIAVTNRCDLSCRHCFVPKGSASLDGELLKNWIDELDANGCLGVGLGGGEPTLFEYLPEICKYISERTSMAVSITTHGHRMNDNLAAALSEHVHFIRVSVDGIGPTYETIRKRSFSSLQRRLEIVRELAPFGINYLVNEQTLPDINEAIDFATDIGASEFLLIPERPVRGQGGVSKPTWFKLIQWVTNTKVSIPLTVSQYGSEGLPCSNPLVKDDGIRSYVHIDAHGVLKKSSYEEEGVRIKAAGIIDALEELEAREKGGS